MPGRQRPIEKFAQAAAKCSVEVLYYAAGNTSLLLTMVKASVYGKCVIADYQSVQKDMCVKEFMRLKECYLVGSIGCEMANRA